MHDAPAMTIHIGLMKTGTTALQRSVFTHCEGLDYFGKPGPRLAGPIRAISTFDEAAWASVLPQLESHVRHVLADAGPRVLISEEEFSVGGEIDSAADRGVIAERLHALFPQAQIVVVVRNQLAALQSLYAYAMALSDRFVSFSAWLDQHHETTTEARGLDVFNYAGLVQIYTRLFSPESVHVLFYEDMVKRYAVFIDQLAGVLGVSNRALSAVPIERHNVRPSLRRVRMAQLARRHPALVQVLDRSPGWVLERLEAYADAGPPIDTRYTPEHRARVSSRYAASNRWLSDFLHVDLQKMEYPCQ